jgi:hypothetical protein
LSLGFSYLTSSNVDTKMIQQSGYLDNGLKHLIFFIGGVYPPL